MAKISWDKIYRAQLKTKIVGVIMVLVVSFVCFELIIRHNAKKALAYNITATTIIDNSFNNGNDLTNQDVIISGSTTIVTMRGSNHFKSLTITNNAKVTHDALLTSDIEADRATVKPASLNKKVDITVDNDLVLSLGGSINVDGKGYPSGDDITLAQWNAGIRANGYGPGGGWGSHHNCSAGGHEEASDGGNHFGVGGIGRDWNGDDYPTTPPYIYNNLGYGNCGFSPRPIHIRNTTQYDTNTSGYDFGYGSGGGSSHDNQYADGGDGGGKIILNVGNQLQIKNTYSGTTLTGNESKITANGMNYGYVACNRCSNDGAIGGSGAGGSIVINTNDFVVLRNNVLAVPPLLKPASVAGGTVSGGTAPAIGGAGIIVSVFPNIEHLYAKGGSNKKFSGKPAWGGGGGGGVIKLTVLPYVPPSSTTYAPTIKKVLLPVYREGRCDVNSDECIFNPYAVQKNDIIQVSLSVTGVAGTYYLQDPLLKVENGGTVTHRCKNPNSFSLSPLDANAETLAWQLTTDATVTYQCTIDPST